MKWGVGVVGVGGGMGETGTKIHSTHVRKSQRFKNILRSCQVLVSGSICTPHHLTEVSSEQWP